MPDTPVYLCWNGNIVTNFPSFMLGSPPPARLLSNSYQPRLVSQSSGLPFWLFINTLEDPPWV